MKRTMETTMKKRIVHKPRTIGGKPVVNGKEKFMLDIIKQDIKKGKGKDPRGCAAAVALLRSDKGLLSVRVHVGRLFLETPTQWIRYKTPRTLRDEIVAFDRGGEFLVGEHEVIPLTPAEQKYLEDKEWKYARKGTGKPKSNRSNQHIVPGVRGRGVVL